MESPAIKFAFSVIRRNAVSSNFHLFFREDGPGIVKVLGDFSFSPCRFRFATNLCQLKCRKYFSFLKNVSQLFESFPRAKRARRDPSSRSHGKGKFSPKAPKTCCWLINSNVFPFIQTRVFTQAVQFFLLRAGGRFFCLST